MRTDEYVSDYIGEIDERYLWFNSPSESELTDDYHNIVFFPEEPQSALAWLRGLTEIYNEIKTHVWGTSSNWDKIIEWIYIHDEDDENEDMYEKSRKKFLSELPNMLEKYEGKYAAFINNDIEIDDSEERLVLKIIQKHGNIPFYLDKVTAEENDIPIMSPKILYETK
jgi:hypothetical protein